MQSMKSWLDQLLELKIIRPIDAGFGRFIVPSVVTQSDDSLLLLVVLISVELGKKNACLDLNRFDINNPLDVGQAVVTLPDLNIALNQLDSYSCISHRGSESGNTPLILHDNRLYLQRYWCYESELALALRQKSANDSQINLAEVSQWFNVLFPDEVPAGEVDWQKMACATALLKRFCVITGGPGTGKTTTVTKLLALQVLMQRSNAPDANPDKKQIIKLVTPTGKAAARLSESIKGAKSRLPLDTDVIELIPDEASTIHRLLGVKPHSSEFIHHKDNPLHLDVLVVDEVSMVDLPMMAKLMAALPAHTKVILLGDKDQLASVEAGSVLGDICAGSGRDLCYSSALLADIQSITEMDISGHCAVSAEPSLSDSICLLQKSHRFDDKSGIGQLAKAVNRSDWFGVKHLRQQNVAHLSFSDILPVDYRRMVRESAEAYQPYLLMIKEGYLPQEIIEQFNCFQLLCAVRKGDFGVSGLNEAIEKELVRIGLIDNRQLYYVGKPIMISQNDYALELFNGDIGIILKDQDSEQLKAWFIAPDGKPKSYYPNRLPSHDPVYAMTVHKSQGSEFEQVSMVLPPINQVINNKVITKELIYTGITRAKTQFNLFSEAKVLELSIRQSTERSSGLAGLLYGG
ncbi:MAG: exodeoxyribonuclease V subunit alpha [Algicola sp.]|nr:exodeoxyribonuclease V subunit alpha [Algicola sp.]